MGIFYIAVQRFWLVGIVLGILFHPGQLLAAEGLVVEPAIQKIYVDAEGLPREAVQKITLKNTTSLELTFLLRAIEFTDLDKSGGNIFLGQSLSEGEFIDAHWITLPETKILLIPGEQKTIDFQLRNGAELRPGAHYGAILFETIRPDTEQKTDPSKIYLRQIATSLLYVNKESKEMQRLSVQGVQRYRTFPRLVENIVVTLVNEGDSFVEPRGFVEVRNVFGRSEGRSTLNESGKTIFPGQERQIEANFTKVLYLFPGPYAFDIFYRIDSGEYQKTSITFWYWEPLAVLGILVGTLLFIWFAFHPTSPFIYRSRK